MMYPLVGDLAAAGIPAAVTFLAIGCSEQTYYTSRARPVAVRDWHGARA